MVDKILIAIIGIQLLMNISLIVIIYNTNNESEPKPIEIKSDFQEHQRIYEMIVNDSYWNSIRDCNISKQLFELQTVNSGAVVIGKFTSIDDWYSDCQRIADERKQLIQEELMK